MPDRGLPTIIIGGFIGLLIEEKNNLSINLPNPTIDRRKKSPAPITKGENQLPNVLPSIR